MERKESSKMEVFEFDLHIDDLDDFKGFFIGGNGRGDFFGLRGCVGGMISFDLRENYSGQHFFWTYTCLPTQTNSLTFDVNDKLAVLVQVTNLMNWDRSMKSIRGM